MVVETVVEVVMGKVHFGPGRSGVTENPMK